MTKTQKEVIALLKEKDTVLIADVNAEGEIDTSSYWPPEIITKINSEDSDRYAFYESLNYNFRKKISKTTARCIANHLKVKEVFSSGTEFTMSKVAFTLK